MIASHWNQQPEARRGYRAFRTVAMLRIFVLGVVCAMLAPAIALANEPTVARNEGWPSTRTDYTVKVDVEVTSDADGWNDAYIHINGVYGNGKYKGVFEDSKNYDGIASSFDEYTHFVREVSWDYFPKEVVIYTDFGGGFTKRSFEADVTVYVNDVNVASKHIMASSSPFSSSNTTHTITIDESKYPYVDKLYLEAPETVQSNEQTATATVEMMAVDQYGTAWRSCESRMSFDGNALTDLSAWYDTLKDDQGKEMDRKDTTYTSEFEDSYRWVVTNEGPKDATKAFTVSFPTNNSSNKTSSKTFNIEFQYLHTVEIRSESDSVETLTGTAGEEIPLDYPDLVVDGYALEWTLEGGGSIVPNGEDGPKYVFGESDGVVTAHAVPYSYKVVFDGNEATGGKMGARIIRVGTIFALPSNCFSRTGYVFAGWNTQPDGTGVAYANKAQVSNLSTVNDDVVTLYAQWAVKTFTVTFVNRITNERTKQTVAYGEAATPPNMPQAASIDDRRHNLFTGWNRKFDKITSNVTITSKHETKPHNFVMDEDGVMRCAECRTEQKGAGAAASVFGEGSQTVIGIGLVLLVVGVVYLVVKQLRKPTEQ